jgi:O-antigen/teichoic acid export membrane protein
VLVGQQRAWEAHLFSAAGAALTCAALWLARTRQLDVPSLLLLTFGIQTVSSLFAAALLANRGLLSVRDCAAGMSTEAGGLVKAGLLFLMLQIGTMVALGMDALIIAGLHGASAVAVYAVAQRLFQFASQPLAMMNAPLWAAYADARALRDTAFIRQTFRRSMTVSLGAALSLSIILLVAGAPLVGLWTGRQIEVPTALLAALAAWTVLEAAGNAFAMYLNGCGIVKQLVWVVAAFCCVALPLKFALGARYGVTGVVLASVLAYLVTTVGMYSTVFRSEVVSPMHDRP